MRGNMMPVVIGTSISSLINRATWRWIPSSAHRARICAFQPESVSTLARRTRAARRMAFSRHRARKNKAPTIHRPSISLGTNAGLEFASDVIGRFRSLDTVGVGVVELVIAAVLTIAEGAD